MNVFDIFRENKNLDKSIAMKAYMRNQFDFLGIAAPQRKKLFNKCIENEIVYQIDWQFIDQCWQQPEREFQYIALDYLLKYKRLLVSDDLYKLRNLVVNKSWWDTVDVLHKLFGYLVQQNIKIKQIMVEYSLDNNIWLRRIAINHQIGFKKIQIQGY